MGTHGVLKEHVFWSVPRTNPLTYCKLCGVDDKMRKVEVVITEIATWLQPSASHYVFV